MTDFEYNTGYFYPLNEEEYKCLNNVDFFGNDIVQPPFYFETFIHNHYLVLVQTQSRGIETHEFGHSRPLTENEKNLVPRKFENEFKIKFDKSKFKYVEYCYSVDCKDYYLESKPRQSETMTLNEAIQHCKDVAASKCDECGKEHAQLAEWLQELGDLRIQIKRLGTELRAKHLKAIHTANKLAAYKDETPITEEWLNANFQLISGQWVVYSPPNDGDVTIFHRGRMYYISFNYHNAAEIITIGQLRMFLTICGFGDFAKQLK